MSNKTKSDAYREAQQRIAKAKQDEATALNLSHLHLRDDELEGLFPEIASLTALQTLSLSGNQLTTLPPEIASLTALQTLWLQDNQLTRSPHSPHSLTALKELWLHNNKLTTLPPEIASLTALQTLRLDDNQLKTLPPEIASLTALQELHLGDNQLTTLPPEIASLANLKALYLHGNPGLMIPSEILGPAWLDIIRGEAKAKPPRDILDYYFSTKTGANTLREVKLILVGRGDVGKTTLADVLQGKPFIKNRPRTDGIKITDWSVKPEGGKATIRIWDFGGQEIMHGTHQFFLTRRAIYIVMVDGRDDRSQRDAEYWLKHTRAFGGDSIVMVIMNRQKNYKFDLDRNALSTKYDVPPDLFFPTECSQKETISPVKKAILRIVADILSKQANFPAKWWEIKKHLEQMKEDHLSDGEYRTLCREKYGIDDEPEQDQLLDRLNDLGTIVHFDDDESLAELKVLNPEWATDGVYRVVTNEELREEKQGKLKALTLKDILPAKRWPKAIHRQYILRLMQRFDLCFPAEGENEVYIVPELLPKQTPVLTDWNPTECVVFRYEYPVLPHGILPRFISKTHMYSEGRERWRSGVILAKDGAEALVRADYDEGVMSIWVRGEHRDARWALLTIIRSRFDEIHNKIKGLNPVEQVAVPQYPTVFVSYWDMILDIRDKEKTVRVTISHENNDERIDIPINEILTGVESPWERRKAIKRASMSDEGKRSIHVEGDLHMLDDHSINIGGDVTNSQVGQTLANCTNTINQQAPGEKKDLLEELRKQVEELIKSLPEDKKDEAPQIAKKLETLVDQATNAKPEREWYSLSAKGLLEASKWTKDFTGNILGTIGQIGKLLWPDYTP